MSNKFFFKACSFWDIHYEYAVLIYMSNVVPIEEIERYISDTKMGGEGGA